MKMYASAMWLCIAVLATASCSRSDPDRKATFPVTGQVYVAGKPAAMVQVALHDLAPMDQNQPTFSSTFTDETGRFALSTYENGDGVPAGKYKMTFLWGELNMLSMQYGGPDKLLGKYSDPETTPYEVKVEEGSKDLGRIELTAE